MVLSDVSGPCVNSYQLSICREGDQSGSKDCCCFLGHVQKKGHTAIRSLELPVEIDDTTTKALSDVF